MLLPADTVDRFRTQQSLAEPGMTDRNQPEAANRVPMGSYAAVAVGRGRDLSSRCLAQSCHWLTQQRGSIDDRYRGSCSHGLAHVSP